jgi:hypothetical protein
MTEIAIQKQIDAIKRGTEAALKSKKTALKFLIDAGILKDKKQSHSATTDKKKK